MKIDTSKLVDALSKVVDLAHREATARSEIDALNDAIRSSQADVDAIAAQLIEAAGSTAAATGIAVVAQALTTPIDQPVAPVAPVFVVPAPAEVAPKMAMLPAVEFAPAAKPKVDLNNAAQIDDILASLK